ncbi:MAG: DUF4097 family beta strand repeat protein [Ignavibacteriales bacterium]|nr:DUF4097 family beta strand repeat protein [Ignavibacteriales bacterium]
MKKVISYLSCLLLINIFLNISAYAQTSRTVNKTVDLPADGIVFIDTYKGSISIETWEKPCVEIIAKIESDDTGDDEEEKVDETQIRIRERDKRVDIITDYDRVKKHDSWFFGWFDVNTGSLPLVHYRIKMPSTASLKIKDYKSDSKIKGLKSDLNIETYKGSMRIENLEGSVNLETYKGEGSIEFSKLISTSKIETYKGKIEIYIPSEDGFKIDTDFGRRVDFDSDFDINYKRSSRKCIDLYESINGGGPLLKLSSEKGDIRIMKKR